MDFDIKWFFIIIAVIVVVGILSDTISDKFKSDSYVACVQYHTPSECDKK